MHPQDTLGYWLSYTWRYVASAFFEILRAHCVERGKPYLITPPQWAMLCLVEARGEQTVGELAQQMGVDAPAITALVRRLEQTGLVERIHDRDDRRVVRIRLSDEGRDISHSLAPIVTAFNEQLLPPEQRDAFLEHLRTIMTAIATIAPDTGSRFSFFKEHLQFSSREEES